MPFTEGGAKTSDDTRLDELKPVIAKEIQI